MAEDLKFIGACETLKSFGTLSFGKRHHPWIRHLKIESSVDEKKKYITYSFSGACTSFCETTLFPLHEDFEDACLATKEAFEDFLAEMFLWTHRLTAREDIFGMENLRFTTIAGIRQTVQQDYEFFKAMQDDEPFMILNAMKEDKKEV
jgi:hypothetical protein